MFEVIDSETCLKSFSAWRRPAFKTLERLIVLNHNLRECAEIEGFRILVRPQNEEKITLAIKKVGAKYKFTYPFKLIHRQIYGVIDLHLSRSIQPWTNKTRWLLWQSDFENDDSKLLLTGFLTQAIRMKILSSGVHFGRFTSGVIEERVKKITIKMLVKYLVDT